VTERKEGDKWGTGSKVKSVRGTWAIIATASGLAKEAENTSIAGSYRTGSDGRCRKSKYGDGNPSTEGRVSSKKPICHGYR